MLFLAMILFTKWRIWGFKTDLASLIILIDMKSDVELVVAAILLRICFNSDMVICCISSFKSIGPKAFLYRSRGLVLVLGIRLIVCLMLDRYCVFRDKAISLGLVWIICPSLIRVGEE